MIPPPDIWTAETIGKTRETWSQRLDRNVSKEEAVEILERWKPLIEILNESPEEFGPIQDRMMLNHREDQSHQSTLKEGEANVQEE
jgi:hypothetical protein